MYYYLNGTVALLEPDRAVIDCGGVGYLVAITRKTFDSLVHDGALGADGRASGLTAKVYTYFHVREDASELYGFYTEAECSLFKMLIAVSGVGPKAALSILSALSADALISAVAAGDAKAISAANGIGLKTAQKIILELKDKLASWEAVSDFGYAAEPEPAADSDVVKEAVNALTVLGYTRAEALKAVKSASGSTLEDIIRSALGKLM